jgi:hypothetical protein
MAVLVKRKAGVATWLSDTVNSIAKNIARDKRNDYCKMIQRSIHQKNITKLNSICC